MARTASYYLDYVLRNNWETDITGRDTSVPQPNIVIAADEDLSRVNLQENDQLFIMDGRVSQRPKSVGWREEEVEVIATLDIRTPHGRERLEGGRDSNNNKERYGGLRGEAERILDSKRKGDKEFDWIDTSEWRNLSEEVGYGFWRGTWEIVQTQLADTIDTEP